MLEQLGHIADTGKKAGATGQMTLWKVRLPDAVVFQLSKGTVLGRKDYLKRSSKTTKYGTRSIIDPLLTNRDKKPLPVDNSDAQPSDVAKIAENLAKLKEACK